MATEIHDIDPELHGRASRVMNTHNQSNLQPQTNSYDINYVKVPKQPESQPISNKTLVICVSIVIIVLIVTIAYLATNKNSQSLRLQNNGQNNGRNVQTKQISQTQQKTSGGTSDDPGKNSKNKDGTSGGKQNNERLPLDNDETDEEQYLNLGKDVAKKKKHKKSKHSKQSNEVKSKSKIDAYIESDISADENVTHDPMEDVMQTGDKADMKTGDKAAMKTGDKTIKSSSASKSAKKTKVATTNVDNDKVSKIFDMFNDDSDKSVDDSDRSNLVSICNKQNALLNELIAIPKYVRRETALYPDDADIQQLDQDNVPFSVIVGLKDSFKGKEFTKFLKTVRIQKKLSDYKEFHENEDLKGWWLVNTTGKPINEVNQ